MNSSLHQSYALLVQVQADGAGNSLLIATLIIQPHKVTPPQQEASCQIQN